MIENNQTKYAYRDISLIPSPISEISSRKECLPFDKDGYYPLFTAPMTSVVDKESSVIFEENKIYSILPRTISFEERLQYGRTTKRWIAVSLKEFHDIFLTYSEDNCGMKVLIDVANGHMAILYDLSKQAKSIYGDKLTIMVGNIANPQTYLYAINAGVDYIRCGIGAGNGCITSSNTAVHYPMASLISAISDVRNNYAHDKNVNIESLPKIVADGGIRNYSDVIKALAIGADYVMVGSVFSSLLESAGEIFIKNPFLEELDKKELLYKDGKFFYDGRCVQPIKRFYGMASKQGQRDMGNKSIKTAEGVEKEIPLTTTVSGWVDNFDSYLRSAMSYTNSKTLNKLKDAQVIVISQGTVASVNQ